MGKLTKFIEKFGKTCTNKLSCVEWRDGIKCRRVYGNPEMDKLSQEAFDNGMWNFHYRMESLYGENGIKIPIASEPIYQYTATLTQSEFDEFCDACNSCSDDVSIKKIDDIEMLQFVGYNLYSAIEFCGKEITFDKQKNRYYINLPNGCKRSEPRFLDRGDYICKNSDGKICILHEDSFNMLFKKEGNSDKNEQIF